MGAHQSLPELLRDSLELQGKAKKKLSRMQEINELARREHRDLTESEKREWEKLSGELESLNATAGRSKQLEEYERFMRGGDTMPDNPHSRDLTGSGPRYIDTKTGKEIRVYRPDETFGHGRSYDLPDGIQPSELSIGRLLRGAATGKWQGAGAEQRAMSTGTGVLGGVLLPTPVSDLVIQSARNKLRVNQAGARIVEMEQRQLTFAAVTKEIEAYFVPENADGTFSDMNFQAIMFTTEKIVALTKVSLELFEDAANLDAIILDSMGYAISKKLDWACLEGTGTGEPRGLYNTDGVGSTDLENATVDIDDFVDAYYALVAKNVEPAAISAIYPAVVGKTIAKLKATGGEYIEPNAPQEWKTLRKFITSQIPTAVNTDAYVGDFQQLFIGIQPDVAVEVSYDAADGTASAFKNSQVWIRQILRVDAAAVRPGDFHIIKNIGVS